MPTVREDATEAEYSSVQAAWPGRSAERIKALLLAGASPDVTDTTGSTAVHLVSAQGLDSSIQALAEAGADMNKRDSFGKTAMHLAASRGKAGAIKALALARPSEASESSTVEPSLKDNDGNTPLHLAAGNEHLDAIHELVRAGADIYAANRQGKPPLQIALRQAREHGSCSLPVWELLLAEWTQSQVRPVPPYTIMMIDS